MGKMAETIATVKILVVYVHINDMQTRRYSARKQNNDLDQKRSMSCLRTVHMRARLP